MVTTSLSVVRSSGRTPHGVRGLKCGVCGHVRSRYRRTPHGVRGLKFANLGSYISQVPVAPLTGCVD